MLVLMGITPAGDEVCYDLRKKVFTMQPAGREDKDLDALLASSGAAADDIEWNEASCQSGKEARRLYDEARVLFREQWIKAQQDADNLDAGPERASEQFNAHLLDNWDAYPGDGGMEAEVRRRLVELIVDGLS